MNNQNWKRGDDFRFYAMNSVSYPILTVDEANQTVMMRSFKGKLIFRSFKFLDENGYKFQGGSNGNK